MQDVLPDSAPSELPPSPTKRDHVMVLPNVGETKRVGITGNSTGIFKIVFDRLVVFILECSILGIAYIEYDKNIVEILNSKII